VPAADRPRQFTRPSKFVVIAVVGLLAVHFALAVSSKHHESTTSDELVHLTGGFNAWQNHDYRLHPENGILPQRWAAIPAWLQGAKFPELSGNDYWRTSDAWVVGHQFFYETGEDHFPRLMAGRAMIALFSVATGLLVFFWSRQFFGDAGGLISLGFFSFSPTFLAHGALVTSDACMAFFFLASVGAWWRHLHDGRALSWWLSALVFGLAFVAKYTAVLLLPMIAIMALIRIFSQAPLVFAGRNFQSRGSKAAAIAVSAIGHALVATAVIWSCYEFRFSAFNANLPAADHFIRPWATMTGPLGLKGKIIDVAGELHALPEAFLYGFSYVLNTLQRSAFLNGEYSDVGWKSFFPWAFLLKTTLPVILGSFLAVAVASARWSKGGSTVAKRDCYRLAPLLVLFGVYWLFSITSHLNIGQRHILPTYPVLFIALGSLVSGPAVLLRPRWLGATAVGLLAWHAGEALWINPHHLAYFNEIAGGPKNGRYHLVDSSLDWGQDLPGLKTWLGKNHPGSEPTFLTYFGSGEPSYYELHARRIAFLNNFKFPTYYVPLEAGVYCISATSLSHVYSPFRGPWTLEFEKRYQKLRELEPNFSAYSRDAEARKRLERDLPPERWQQMMQEHDLLRFARLCHYLRIRTPDAQIGYSIWIFRLTGDEVTRATAGPLADWSGLIEKAVETKRAAN
jgi:hypothetical protein